MPILTVPMMEATLKHGFSCPEIAAYWLLMAGAKQKRVVIPQDEIESGREPQDDDERSLRGYGRM